MHARAIRRATDRLYGIQTVRVNAYLYGDPAKSSRRVLIDGGMPGFSSAILNAAARLFGKDNPPAAIILTHGHFDHVGAVGPILRKWDFRVMFTHWRWDISVERKITSRRTRASGKACSHVYHRYFPGALGITVMPCAPFPPTEVFRLCPAGGGSTPPGQKAGHISLFRGSDHTVIAGDAFTTVRQSFWAVFYQRLELRPPPAYFTTDWAASCISMKRLANLAPYNAATGHGRVPAGPVITPELQRLVYDFGERGVPRNGKYVQATWRDEAMVSDRQSAAAGIR